MGVVKRARWAFRRGLAPLRLRPTFLVIGAQKSGTTSLYRYLDDHPAVVCASQKEVHYFDLYPERSTSWYLTHYPLRTRALAIRRRHGVWPPVGELTPEYLFNPRVPERVQAFDPSLRLIAVLRDPVDRAYSQYQMQVRKYGETRPFEEVLAFEDEHVRAELEKVRRDPGYVWSKQFRQSYVSRGRYAEQLERWLALFPREQLLVLTSEEMWAAPDESMITVTRFIGAPDWRRPTYPRQSFGTHEPMATRTREQLARIFEPENRRLEALLGRTLDWTRPTTLATARAAAAPAADAS